MICRGRCGRLRALFAQFGRVNSVVCVLGWFFGLGFAAFAG